VPDAGHDAGSTEHLVMLAECGRCGWTQEVDDEREAVAEYARHCFKKHPEVVPNDPAVLEFMTEWVGHVATSNGRPF